MLWKQRIVFILANLIDNLLMLFRFKRNYTHGIILKKKEEKNINPQLNIHRLKLRSSSLDRKLKVDIYLPSNTENISSTLMLNDGQDMEQLNLVEALTAFFSSEEEIIKFAVVAVHANENRLREYGVAGLPDFRRRGKNAAKYSDFITQELTPFLQKHYGLLKEEHQNVFAGFSMGGLSALDISWSYPGIFSKVGIFSGSLWWRSKNTGTPKDDASRIMHQRIRESEKREGLKFWFQTGTKDETRDRNKNGIIDSIDDTRDLITELKKLGYTNEDIVYEEMEGGEHNFHTWSRMFPEFLLWAFA